MDSLSVDMDGESSPKRIKLDPGLAISAQMCTSFSVAPISPSQHEPAAPGQVSTPEIYGQIEADLMQYDSSNQEALELEPDDDNSSTISGLSDMSGRDWKPMTRSLAWVQKQMQDGVDPRVILSELDASFGADIPQFLDDVTLWKIIVNLLNEPPQRQKLRHVNSLSDIVKLLRVSRNIVVLTGAGVSVSCGIPDFRSRDGIYLRLSVDFPDLPDPQAMFDIGYFNQDPRPFYKFAKDIYPGTFRPSPCHNFIRMLEKRNKLLRNYTQNIDTLEKVAEIERVIECHGSFATATCTKCGHKVTAEMIREPILAQKIPLCTVCHGGEKMAVNPDEIEGGRDELSSLVSSGIMKPDIVFFGEGLPDSFHESMTEDKTKCDLLIVIGSSLKVKPVAFIPNSLPSHVPQILINREPLPHCHFDVELLGDCDVIVNHLCRLLGEGWEEGVHDPSRPLHETLQLLPLHEPEDSRYKVELPQQEDDDDDDNENGNNSLLMSKSPSLILSRRNVSTDSTRDSGIGENSNMTDCCQDSDLSQSNISNAIATKFQHHRYNDDSDASPTMRSNNTTSLHSDTKQNFADRLPPDSYYLIRSSRYIFPGAELFYDPHENYHHAYFDDVSSSDSSESESEIEIDDENSLSARLTHDDGSLL